MLSWKFWVPAVGVAGVGLFAAKKVMAKPSAPKVSPVASISTKANTPSAVSAPARAASSAATSVQQAAEQASAAVIAQQQDAPVDSPEGRGGSLSDSGGGQSFTPVEAPIAEDDIVEDNATDEIEED